MLIEQSFRYLPEILTGNRYPKQDYESGIVVAFTLAILQELNGRNASNPLSYIQAEKLYRPNGLFPRNETPRYLRADLQVNLENLLVSNRLLAQYGWRHQNWIEAKFRKGETERNTRDSGNKTTYSSQTLADIIRLSILVLERPGVKSSSSRYFLHVYDGPPNRYLAFRNRPWLKKLTTSGIQNIEINNLNTEAITFKNNLGDILDLNLELELYNHEIIPISSEHIPVYYCYLTRIDKVKATLNGQSFSIEKNRFVTETNHGTLKDIVGYVSSNLHLQPSDEKQEEDEEAIREDNVGQNADDNNTVSRTDID